MTRSAADGLDHDFVQQQFTPSCTSKVIASVGSDAPSMFVRQRPHGARRDSFDGWTTETVVVLADTLLRLEIFATTMVSPAAAMPPGSGMSNPEAVRRSTTEFLSVLNQTRYGPAMVGNWR